MAPLVVFAELLEDGEAEGAGYLQGVCVRECVRRGGGGVGGGGEGEGVQVTGEALHGAHWGGIQPGEGPTGGGGRGGGGRSGGGHGGTGQTMQPRGQTLEEPPRGTTTGEQREGIVEECGRPRG